MALINLRNALMAGKRLPYDAEVEYLESTGTQYIDTGVPGVDGYTFKADFMFTSLYSSYNYLAGSNGSSSNRIYFTRLDRSNGLFGMTYNTSPASVYAGVATGTRYSVETAAIRGNQYVKVDGTTVLTNNAESAVNTGLNFYLFCASSNGASGTTGQCAAKLYSAQFYDSNGVLVRDFIPVRVGTTGALYDKRGVGGMNPDGSPRNDGMYFNRGTGNFGYSNDK